MVKLLVMHHRPFLISRCKEGLLHGAQFLTYFGLFFSINPAGIYPGFTQITLFSSERLFTSSNGLKRAKT